MRSDFGGTTTTSPLAGSEEARPPTYASGAAAPSARAGIGGAPLGSESVPRGTDVTHAGSARGTAGTTFTGQGTAGGEALGGGVMDPTPVDRKQGT